MKNIKLKLAVLGAFSVLSAQAMATGFLSLPTAGLSVAAGANQPAGTTAYVRCNTTGNYGSDPAGYTVPTAGANNTCAVFPANTTTAPTQTDGVAFSLVSGSSVTTNITANGETLAFMDQRTWRRASNTECIYGKRIRMNTAATFDYNPSVTGTQLLEVNDVALGGFSATANVLAGYYHTAISDSPVFRMGRAFTAVQMQSDALGTSPATGYVHRPITTTAPASGTEINGVGQTLVFPGSPTAAQQTADIRTNWVDFTQDVTGGVDVDGTTSPNTSMMYVRAACTASAPATTANTVRLREAGQEDQPWVTILASGQTAVGANANF